MSAPAALPVMPALEPFEPRRAQGANCKVDRKAEATSRRQIDEVNAASHGVSTAAVLYDSQASQPNDSVNGTYFASAQDCAAAGHYDSKTCSTAYAEAVRQHEATAPRYGSVADCEADFGAGRCMTLPPLPGATGAGATSVIVPAMIGMVVGGGIGSLIAPSVLPVYRSCAPEPGHQPCDTPGSNGSGPYGGHGYIGGHWYTGGGYTVNQGSGTNVSVSRGAFSSPGTGVTLARGGFGARAAFFGMHGG